LKFSLVNGRENCNVRLGSVGRAEATEHAAAPTAAAMRSCVGAAAAENLHIFQL